MLQNVTIDWVEMFFSTNNWGKADQDDQLGNAFLAAAKTMITSAILQTNDPVRIARFSGIPTPYVSSVVWNLDRNPTWLQHAYSELASLISATVIDQKTLSDVLLWAMEEFLEAEQAARIDLVSLWNSISWYVDDNLPSIHAKPTTTSTQ